MVNVVHGPNESIPHSCFAPWESWSPEENVSFHDRIAEGIKDKTLSADNVAAVVLQLLTHANDIALALIKEVQYADSTCVDEVNTCALVAAQRRIAKACDLLRGKNNTRSSKASKGDLMLHMHSDITHECFAAMRMANTFYRKLNMWLSERDEKCGHVVRMTMLLVNSIDAVQQCHCSAFPDEYITHDDEALGRALTRAEHSLKIVTNALNAVKIPMDEDARGRVAIKKSALSSSASLLISTFKLLNLAARRAYTEGKVRDVRVYDHMQAIVYCCGFRSLIIRTIVDELVAVMSKRNDSSQLLVCNAASWALSQLSDDIHAVSEGTYADFEKSARYATKVALDMAECVTALSLICAAYESKGKKDSKIGELLERSKEMACAASLECMYLEEYKAHNLTTASSIKKLYDVLAYAEAARGDLAAINMRELLHTAWSSSLLGQAIATIDRALEECTSQLGIEEAQIRKRAGRHANSASSTLGDLRKKTAHRRHHRSSRSGSTSRGDANCRPDHVVTSGSISSNPLGRGGGVFRF